jgi:hypothetical protein
VPLVVRMKGTNEDLGKKMLAESGLPIISADTMAEAAEKSSLRPAAVKISKPRGNVLMSILINKDTRVVTQGITGKTGQFHTEMCQEYANGKNVLRGRREPEEGGRGLRRHPDLRFGERGQGSKPA